MESDLIYQVNKTDLRQRNRHVRMNMAVFKIKNNNRMNIIMYCDNLIVMLKDRSNLIL